MLAQQIGETVVACSLDRMPRDFKRILKVQFKEFLHYLDEAPSDTPLAGCLSIQVKYIKQHLEQLEAA